MKVLITGAFGNLGLMCLQQALEQGFEVRCFDLDIPYNQKLADKYQGRVEVILGDIRNANLHSQLVKGVDAIIHNASLLPPATDNFPELAYEINVTACQRLIHAAEQSDKSPVFIFPSSVTVFGLAKVEEDLLSADMPVFTSDNYTQHKIVIEEYLKQSGLPWVILRVGVSVDARTLSTDRKTFKKLLSVRADNPLEYVHPLDVAFAMCRACITREALNKILLIGGGKHCQINQYQFLKTAFSAAGLHLPETVHGQDSFYTHWMDTVESQAILQFQHRDFLTYQVEMEKKLAKARFLLKPLSFILNPLLPFLLKRL